MGGRCCTAAKGGMPGPPGIPICACSPLTACWSWPRLPAWLIPAAAPIPAAAATAASCLCCAAAAMFRAACTNHKICTNKTKEGRGSTNEEERACCPTKSERALAPTWVLANACAWAAAAAAFAAMLPVLGHIAPGAALSAAPGAVSSELKDCRWLWVYVERGRVQMAVCMVLLRSRISSLRLALLAAAFTPQARQCQREHIHSPLNHHSPRGRGWLHCARQHRLHVAVDRAQCGLVSRQRVGQALGKGHDSRAIGRGRHGHTPRGAQHGLGAGRRAPGGGGAVACWRPVAADRVGQNAGGGQEGDVVGVLAARAAVAPAPVGWEGMYRRRSEARAGKGIAKANDAGAEQQLEPRCPWCNHEFSIAMCHVCVCVRARACLRAHLR